MTIKAKAPGVVKLFGEHAVVHGRTAVAAAISVFAEAEIEPNGGSELSICLDNFKGKSVSLSRNMLESIYDAYASRTSIEEYKKGIGIYDGIFQPYITIAARLQGEFGISAIGNAVHIKSEIISQRGLASSAACSTAFTKAILLNSGVTLPDDKAIDVARDGERVVHKNEGSGWIDVPPSYYGGIVRASNKGITSLEVKNDLKLMLIDTGPKIPTWKTVQNVTDLFANNNAYAESICDQIDECSRFGVDALMSNDIKSLGAYMYKNQELLKELGVSSESIDEAVEISKETGILGAKLSGGGGGGIVVAVTDGKVSKDFYDRMKEKGFMVNEAGIYINLSKEKSKDKAKSQC